MKYVYLYVGIIAIIIIVRISKTGINVIIEAWIILYNVHVAVVHSIVLAARTFFRVVASQDEPVEIVLFLWVFAPFMVLILIVIGIINFLLLRNSEVDLSLALRWDLALASRWDLSYASRWDLALASRLDLT